MKIKIIDTWLETNPKKLERGLNPFCQLVSPETKKIKVHFPKKEAILAEAKRLEQEALELRLSTMTSDEICIAYTGYTPSDYQKKFGIAWNE